MKQSTEVTNLLQKHSSIRNFSERKVDKEVIKEIIASAQMASTSSYVQAYTIIGVTDLDKREQFVELSGGQKHIASCSNFFVFCADLHRLEIASKNEGIDIGWNLDNTEMFIISTVDATLAAQNAAIAAESFGLGFVYIGGIRNNPSLASGILGLPKRVYPVFGMCIGYPAEVPGVKPRLPQEAVYFEDYYPSDAQTKEQLDSYNLIVRDYYKERTNGETVDTWTKKMTNMFQSKVRGHMKGFLNDQGFPLK